MRNHPYVEWSVPEPIWQGRVIRTVEYRDPETDKIELVPLMLQKCVGYEYTKPQCSVCAWDKSHISHR